MSHPSAGTNKKGLLSQVDYLAPLPIPTGVAPVDILNNIWRKNDIYMDVGTYAIGSVVMGVWPIFILILSMGYFGWEERFFYIYAIGSGLIIGIPIVM